MTEKKPSSFLPPSSLMMKSVPVILIVAAAILFGAPSLAMAQQITSAAPPPTTTSSPLSLTPQEQEQQARLQNITATITQSLAQGQKQIGGVVFTPRWSDPVWVEPGASSVLFAYCLPGEFAYSLLPGEFANVGQQILGGPELKVLESHAAAVTPDFMIWYMVVQNQDQTIRLPAAAGVICASDLNDAQTRVLSPEEQQQINTITQQFTTTLQNTQGTTTTNIDQVINSIKNNNATNQNSTTGGGGGGGTGTAGLPSSTPSSTTTSPDTTAPILTVPNDMVLPTNGTTALLEYSVTARDDRDGTATLNEENELIQGDNVGGNITISCSPPSPYFLPSLEQFGELPRPVGDQTVQCSAKDAAGNEGRASFIVSVTSTTATTPPGGASSGGGITASLSANPATYNGPCPATIQFSGTITDNVGNRDVKYRFIRSDGATGPEQVIHFNQPGSQTVSDSWNIGISYKGWVAIEITQPIQLQSNQAQFQITCTPSTGGAPPAGPSSTGSGTITASIFDIEIGKDDKVVSPTATYNGPCPVTMNFFGTITDNVGNRDVKYRIIIDDGVSGEQVSGEQVIHFDQPGSETTSYGGDYGDINKYPLVQGWAAIEILQPIQLQSNQAQFQITCTPSTGAPSAQTLQGGTTEGGSPGGGTTEGGSPGGGTTEGGGGTTEGGSPGGGTTEGGGGTTEEGGGTTEEGGGGGGTTEEGGGD